MTSEVTLGTALNQQSKTQAAKTGLAEDFSQFLNLLTVQLQNQDPLNPMDTTEFTNQLVAFTGVEQQINTNQKLDSLVALQLGNTMGSALGYVGLDVSYISSEFHYDGTQAPKITYALDAQSVGGKVRVYNEEGRLVYETAAATAAGKHDFTWDGKDSSGKPAPAGTYEIKVDAVGVDEKAVGYSTVVSGRVRGVETQDGLIFLLVGERAVSTGNVLNASQPPANTNTTTTQS
ncbi:MAG: flagellar hook capping family protein [Alphaproteobacteria bacterium]|nr:flagellar hook capping family protein [Alphaproteobacteria bacterium]